jgi:hypothetical protein
LLNSTRAVVFAGGSGRHALEPLTASGPALLIVVRRQHFHPLR